MTLVLEHVAKRYGAKRVLVDATLALEPGAITVLLGRNGAGKSTLLRLALGALSPDEGFVRVRGLDPRRGAARRAIGYVPDRPDVPPWMSARELYRFLAPQYASWDARAAGELAARFHVPLDQPFAELSRGQAAAAQLAAALAVTPALLLLDEPFSGLDPLARERFLAQLVESVPLASSAVLVATHELDIAARIADRVAVLESGRIAAHAALDHVLALAEGRAAMDGLKRLLLRPEAVEAST